MFYHSHTSFQRGDGLFGPLVVHGPQETEPHYDLYDHDCDTPTGDCEFVLMVYDLNQISSAQVRQLQHHFMLRIHGVQHEPDLLPLGSVLNYLSIKWH